MCVCVFLCCVVLCFGRGLVLDWSPNQGILPNVCGSRSPLRKAKVRKDCRSQLKKKILRKEAPHYLTSPSSCLNLVPETGYPGWGCPWLFSVPSFTCWDSSIFLKVGYDRFLPHSFQLIVHNHLISTLYKLYSWKGVIK
jgi:hypothetical protein